jgi:hypothetical protein
LDKYYEINLRPFVASVKWVSGGAERALQLRLIESKVPQAPTVEFAGSDKLCEPRG